MDNYLQSIDTFSPEHKNLLKQIQDLKLDVPITSKFNLDAIQIEIEGFQKKIKEKNAKKIESNQNFNQNLKNIINELRPWRKGPFKIFSEYIDSEWDSSIKWNHIKGSLPSLHGKTILDIGCNNGYYMFKALEMEPKKIIGIDPTPLYYLQYSLINQFINQNNLDSNLEYYLIGHENLAELKTSFDVVFCFGILYHTTDPISLLRRIHQRLAKGGQLIVESQGIPGDESHALFPRGKYAGAKGMYFLPTKSCLENWILRSGYSKVNTFHVHPLTELEQSKSIHSPFASFETALNPTDKRLTSEGYPAPLRMYLQAFK